MPLSQSLIKQKFGIPPRAASLVHRSCGNILPSNAHGNDDLAGRTSSALESTIAPVSNFPGSSDEATLWGAVAPQRYMATPLPQPNRVMVGA